MDKPHGRLPGLRAAIVVYVLIVVGLLGGGAAFALWSQSGTAAIQVTAAPVAPQTVGSAITCKRQDTANAANITVTWGATDASGYVVTVLQNGAAFTQPATVRASTAPTHTAVLAGINQNKTDDYVLQIVPFIGNADDSSTWVRGQATSWTMTLTKSGQVAHVTCA